MKLILSDCKTDGKNLCFTITKPFDKMLKTPKISKWCAILCDYRTENYEDFKELGRKMLFIMIILENINNCYSITTYNTEKEML